MNSHRTLALLFALLVLIAGCKSFRFAEAKSNARRVAEAGVLYVRYTSGVTPNPGRHGSGTASASDCGDCPSITPILSIELVKDPSDPYQNRWNLCFDQSHYQFLLLARLNEGDTVSFEYVEQPTQHECSSGAYVRLRR